MNIFLINHYAGSPEMGMEYRPYYLAKEWIKLGHDVTILVATHSHIRKYNPEIQQDIKEEIVEGIRYIWVKTPKYSGNGIGRIKNMFAFIQKTLYKASYFVKTYKPDVIIASSTYPSDNYVARKMAKLSGAKYIYEVHDLWPLSPMELGGMSRYHPFIVAMQHAENFAYRKADAVVSMLPKTQEHMRKHGLDLKKWHYIPNGIVVDDWNNTENLSDDYKKIFNDLKKQNKIIIGYTGGHALSNSLNTIIDAADHLKNNSDFVFVLVGSGNEKENLQQQVQSKQLSNVLFLDPVSKNQIPELLGLMDFLIITWNKSSLYRFGINPNKIFDYMMAQKPIIHATDAPNNFVDEAQCGIAVPPEDSNAVVDAVLRLSKMSKNDLKQMGQNGKSYVIENYDYKVLAQRFIDVFNT